MKNKIKKQGYNSKMNKYYLEYTDNNFQTHIEFFGSIDDRIKFVKRLKSNKV